MLAFPFDINTRSDSIFSHQFSIRDYHTMAGEIKLLHYLQSRYRAIGIYPPRSNQKRGSFNFKNSIPILILIPFLVLSLLLFFSEAKSAYDYGISFFGSNTSVAMLIFYPITILRMPDILTLIKNCEEFIEKSKRNSEPLHLGNII